MRSAKNTTITKGRTARLTSWDLLTADQGDLPESTDDTHWAQTKMIRRQDTRKRERMLTVRGRGKGGKTGGPRGGVRGWDCAGPRCHAARRHARARMRA